MEIPEKREEDGSEKREGKPLRTLNRVPRACTACRKQKMRCEGAENPPCRRCRNGGLECLFEKPSREATLTGEAGLERIRSLENHVYEIKQGQLSVQSLLGEILGHLQHNALASSRPPSIYQPPSQYPTSSTPTASSTSPGMHDDHGTPIQNIPGYSMQSAPQSRVGRPMHPYPQGFPPEGPHQPQPPYPNGSGFPHAGPSLPPLTTLQSAPGSLQQSRPGPPRHDHPPASGQKRPRANTLNLSGGETYIGDDDDDLPASGLVAPWEVLRGLADVAIERAAKENGDPHEIPSRPRTTSPERQTRPMKRRKFGEPDVPIFEDVVTKNIISEPDAHELFRIFYAGCSTFLPVFDANTDTLQSLRTRSAFAVDCICMIGARVRDGGRISALYLRCLQEVQAISCSTLFSPVTSIESVQAMLLVSGWSDNGWLSGGHAVRMGLELSLHKAWPMLLQRIRSNDMSPEKDQELMVATRTWLCLYLFEHQLSYGTGRPAVLKDDESIAQARLLLQHPSAIEDDMRLVSTVELMAVRERLHSQMSSVDEPVKDRDFEQLTKVNYELQGWYATWDNAFSQKYADAAFYRQSLQFQHITAELYHNATALRGIHGPEDVERMPQVQRELAIRSIQIARRGLDISVNAPAYAEGMKYAVHYTHATATFAASFLLRLARLFPNDCDIVDTRRQVELLANHMSTVPGRRYALTLQVMLKRSRKRSESRSPAVLASAPDIDRSSPYNPYPPMQPQDPRASLTPGQFQHQHHQQQSQHQQQPPTDQAQHGGGANYFPEQVQQQQQQQADAEHIWRGYESTENAQLPVWMSDQSLGGNTFSKDGMNAFLLPANYMPSAPHMW